MERMSATPAPAIVCYPSNRGPSTALDSLPASVPPDSFANRRFSASTPLCSYVHAGPYEALAPRADWTAQPADRSEVFRVG